MSNKAEYKVVFNIDSDLIKLFDKYCKYKGVSRKEGLTKLIKAFTKKQKMKGIIK